MLALTVVTAQLRCRTAVVAAWNRAAHHVPAHLAPAPCKCSARAAAEADHAMVRETVAKMTQMRHDNPSDAWPSVPAAAVGGRASLPGLGR